MLSQQCTAHAEHDMLSYVTYMCCVMSHHVVLPCSGACFSKNPAALLWCIQHLPPVYSTIAKLVSSVTSTCLLKSGHEQQVNQRLFAWLCILLSATHESSLACGKMSTVQPLD
jgi:hypothetical protein